MTSSSTLLLHYVIGVALHEDDVRALDGDIGSGTDGEADVGLRQGRSVVDPVPSSLVGKTRRKTFVSRKRKHRSHGGSFRLFVYHRHLCLL